MFQGRGRGSPATSSLLFDLINVPQKALHEDSWETAAALWKLVREGDVETPLPRPHGLEPGAVSVVGPSTDAAALFLGSLSH